MDPNTPWIPGHYSKPGDDQGKIRKGSVWLKEDLNVVKVDHHLSHRQGDSWIN